MRKCTDSNAYLFEFGHVELVWNYRMSMLEAASAMAFRHSGTVKFHWKDHLI